MLICKKYEEFDNRIKVYSKINEGVAKARNFGIENSAGKYLMFCDSDDYVNKDWVSVLLNYAKENNNKLIIFGYADVNKTGEISQRSMYNCDKVLFLDDYFLVYKSRFSPYLWNKIFLSYVVKTNNIRFKSVILQWLFIH